MCDQIKNASIEWLDERTPISKKFNDSTQQAVPSDDAQALGGKAGGNRLFPSLAVGSRHRVLHRSRYDARKGTTCVGIQ